MTAGECPYCKGKSTEAFQVDMSQNLLLILQAFSKNMLSTIQQAHMAEETGGGGELCFNFPARMKNVN